MSDQLSVAELIERATSQLREFRARDEHLASTERGIQEERRRLANRIERIQNAIETWREIAGLPAAEPPVEQVPLLGVDLTRVDLRRMSVPDACEAILRASGGEAATQDMLRVLQQAGKLGPEQTNYGTVHSALRRHPNRFEKVSKGRWRLAEARTNGQYPQEPSWSLESENGA